MSRTLVDIDEKLLAEAARVSGKTTKRAVITEALEEMVRRHRQAQMMQRLDSGLLRDLDDPEVVRSAQR